MVATPPSSPKIPKALSLELLLISASTSGIASAETDILDITGSK
eukprot:CAMPEP_0196820570 /NCGR_PEP_ID=MMETSP1362-20130617/75899_1 /TAXON_ID=163516 /ORGANISM="Leptocylindrus danicus, Strain CCMP1856" /LENGTH=43 /DNA_ID= /DNA_START= /DNA_END= /DNA_ORIENTATION=